MEGKVSGSKKLTDVYGDKFNAKSKLTGKASGSKTLTGVFGSTFEVTAKLSEHISGLSDFVSSVANKLKSSYGNRIVPNLKWSVEPATSKRVNFQGGGIYPCAGI